MVLRLLERTREGPGAREARLAQVEAELGIRLPDDYRADQSQGEGGELWMPNGEYVQLLTTEELVWANRIP